MVGVGHACEEFCGDGGRFDAGDADAGESGEFVQGVGDVGDGVAEVVVGTKVDSGEDEFADSSGNEVAGFFEEVFEVSGAGSTSGKGNDAEGAHEVATILDLEVGPLGKWKISNEGDGEVVSVYFVADDDRLFVFGVAEVVEDVVLFLIADDEVDTFNLGDFFIPHLRIAADHSSDCLRIAASKLANGRTRFGIRNAGDGAGVDDGKVSFFLKGHNRVTTFDQLVPNVIGFRLVEPATKGV